MVSQGLLCNYLRSLRTIPHEHDFIAIATIIHTYTHAVSNVFPVKWVHLSTSVINSCMFTFSTVIIFFHVLVVVCLLFFRFFIFFPPLFGRAEEELHMCSSNSRCYSMNDGRKRLRGDQLDEYSLNTITFMHTRL